tara:strand:+ start:4922 stop:6397 length:1476 start_codon:yes stop_codon:yes gene_type:complete
MNPKNNLILLLGYFLVLIAVSFLTSRRTKSTSFYLGDRKSPWLLVSIGMIGASLSGVTYLSVPGWVSSIQFKYVQMILGYLVGYAIIALLLLPIYYKHQLTSIYTYLEQRFGKNAYYMGSTYFMISRTIGASFRLFLVANVLHLAIFSSFGLPFPFTVALTLLLIFTYSFVGGIKTIVYTDVMQTILMLLAVLVSIYYLASALHIPWLSIPKSILESPYGEIFDWDWKSSEFFPKSFLGGVFIAVVMTGLDQDMMQKNLSINTLEKAQKNMFTQIPLFFFANLIFLVLGFLLVLYKKNIGFDTQSLETSDDLFSLFALQHKNWIIASTFFIGLIAAAYSSADSAITALTTSFCVDFLGFERYRETNKVTRRWVHFGFSAVIFFVIILFKQLNNDAVIKQLFTAVGFTYGPLLGAFAFGIFTQKKIYDPFIWHVSIIAIALTVLYHFFMPKLIIGYQAGFEILIFNGMYTYIGLLLLSRYERRRKNKEVISN